MKHYQESETKTVFKFKVFLSSIVLMSIGIVALTQTGQAASLIPLTLGALLCATIIVPKYLSIQRDRKIIANARQELAVVAKPSLTLATSEREHEQGQFLTTRTRVGTRRDTGQPFWLPLQDRFSGTYVLGVQGSGKSNLMLNLILQDIQTGKGAVIVIDPHGDLVESIVARVADEHLWRIAVIDMTDTDFPFSLNIFATGDINNPIARTQAVDRVFHVFSQVWPDILEAQQYLPRYLRASIITLFSNPGSTLVNMYNLLTDDDYRQELLTNVTDQTVKTFWATQYDELTTSARMQRVGPLVGRLESLFMGRELVSNIVGQSENSINFREAIENGEIILIKLPIKTLASDAKLIGTIILSQIHAALFSFSDLPEHQRPGFGLYVDEVQHFTTPLFTELFTEGRKFGARVCIAHQFRGQLPSYLQQSTMTARNKICFQTMPEDARELAHLFPDGEAAIRPEDINPHPVAHLLAYGIEGGNHVS